MQCRGGLRGPTQFLPPHLLKRTQLEQVPLISEHRDSFEDSKWPTHEREFVWCCISLPAFADLPPRPIENHWSQVARSWTRARRRPCWLQPCQDTPTFVTCWTLWSWPGQAFSGQFGVETYQVQALAVVIPFNSLWFRFCSLVGSARVIVMSIFVISQAASSNQGRGRGLSHA